MENEKQLKGNKKTIMIIVGAVVVIAIIIAIVMSGSKKQGPEENVQTPENQGETNTPVEGENAEGAEGEGAAPVETEAANPVLKGAVVQAPGADLVTTEGKVVNQEGKEVKTDVAYNSPEAPHQTMALTETEKKEVIGKATKLSLDSNGFTPKEFRIGAGEALTITLTGSDGSSHILAFADPKLSAVYINVRPGETRAVTFNVPKEKGSYIFFDDFPGARQRGFEGTMIVE